LMVEDGERMIPDGELTALIVDDNEDIREALARAFERKGWRAYDAANGRRALEILRANDVQVMFVDLKMPGMDGIELLKTTKTLAPEVEVVVITGYGTIEKAVEAMKEGACDFLVKPVKRRTVMRAAQRALARRAVTLGPQMSALDLPRPILGKSSRINKLLDEIRRVAPTSATVLIDGESGSGKELVAEALHLWGDHGAKPLVRVNCAALPETLLEAELFGNERGAYTGAFLQRKGRFELAQGGTILLDEIGVFSPATQVKLLRVLQDGQFERVGGTETISTDARVIAATNQDLDALVEDGSFRRDLYYRLNVVRLHVPALRDRSEDIPLLVDHFLSHYAKKNAREGMRATAGALAVLCGYAWPGNVRELEHAIERAVVMCRTRLIDCDDLPESIVAESARRENLSIPLGSTLQEVERRLIEETIRYTDGDKAHAARILGIAPRTIYRKLRPPRTETEGETRD